MKGVMERKRKGPGAFKEEEEKGEEEYKEKNGGKTESQEQWKKRRKGGTKGDGDKNKEQGGGGGQGVGKEELKGNKRKLIQKVAKGWIKFPPWFDFPSVPDIVVKSDVKEEQCS